MSLAVARALGADALYQVLDERIFRVLLALTIVLVAPAWLVGARPDAVVVLFGWREYPYEPILELLGIGASAQPPNELLVAAVQGVFVDYFAGVVGIFFSVAATAAFVPRMLERGSADVLFSKPVSRGTLLLGRYLAGLVFVALLAVLLVGGIHLGLIVNSGTSDPGFLWSIPTLVYLFAVLHSVSVLTGVVARSSSAAIFVTLIFFVATGCVHRAWTWKEFLRERAADTAPTADGEEAEASSDGRLRGAVRGLELALDAAHWTLPKTSDARYLARHLRRSLEEGPAAWRDAELGVALAADPEGLSPEGGDPRDAEGLRWAGGGARLVLRRGPRERERERDPGAAPRARPSLLSLLRERERELEDDPHAGDVRRADAPDLGSYALGLEWTATPADGPDEARALWLFTSGGDPDALWTLELTAPAGWLDGDGRRAALERFARDLRFEREADSTDDPETWYQRRFGWTAPPRFNAALSLASTLAFVALALGLALWRLARLDF